MSKIKDIKIRKILDSRGNWTVEVDVLSANGFGRCSAPAGASTGKYEVIAYPGNIDNGIEKFRKEIIKKLIGAELKISVVDNLLKEIDGTENFSNIGGNIAIATSIAVAKACANEANVPLYKYIGDKAKMPYSLGNVLGGGKHAIGGTDIQEYLAISFGKKAQDNIFANAMVHKVVGEKLKKVLGGAIGKGDEGGWVANLGNEEAMKIVYDACKDVSKQCGFEVKLSLDFAASELYKNGYYIYKDGKLTIDEQIDYIKELVENYELYSVEDPLEQNDFDGYALLTKKIGKKCIIVGDDLFVTNKKRLEKGIKLKACNAILIKPNQIGTLTDTIETIKIAHNNAYKTFVSHRSGETTDETIAHIAFGLGCHAIKTGVIGGERIAKLNELIRISEGEDGRKD